MKYLIVFIILVFPLNIIAQEDLNLEKCLQAAVENHPRAGDKELMESISGNNILNVNSKWKPEVNLNGQFTYQSDVIDIGDMAIVGFPLAPQDQYKLYFDLKQTFYDGGRIKQQKVIEEISMKSGLKQLESEIETVKADVIEMYYNILQLQEGIDIQSLMMTLLEEKEAIIFTGIENGVMMESDLSLLEIEILQIEQEKRSSELQKNAIIYVLSGKCNLEMNENTVFTQSNLAFKVSELNRRELEFFQSQKELLDATMVIKEKNRLPVLYGFGQLGYGNPGLNMLSDEFDTYYYVGAGLKWNLWDWKDTRREKENLVYQNNLIDNKKLEFEQNVRDALINQQSVIQSHEENITSLKILLEKRMGIVKTYESQLREGTIKTIDYLSVVNEEKIARIKLLNENISLQKAIAKYNYLNGEL
ncbi:MAG: TolC family protein [Bacteroidales bacterium]|nr:TolC family protein [Bacteroidales bacterium]